MIQRLLLGLIFILLSINFGAQERGSITGKDLSESAQPLANVRVNLLNYSFETKTSGDGFFSGSALWHLHH